MASAFTAGVSSLTLSEAAQFLVGNPVAWEEDSVDADTQRLLRYVLVAALATSAAASAVASEVDAAASVEETGAAFGVALTVALVAAASVVVIVALAVLPMALVARPTLPAAPALPLADTAVDLTVIATTTEAEDMDDVMTTEAVAAIAAAAAVSIDRAQVATWSRLVPDRTTAAIAAIAVVVVVGIAIGATMTAEEAMTIAEGTILASVRTKAARATRESESCVDTNGGRTRWSCGGYLESTVFAFLVSISPLSTPRVSRPDESQSFLTAPWSILRPR